jgi:hypothetical protein
MSHALPIFGGQGGSLLLLAPACHHVARATCLDQARRFSANRNTASTPLSSPRDDGSP